MAPGLPVADGSQVLRSVNSAVAPWRARLTPNVFRWSTDFSRRSPFRGEGGRQVFMSIRRPPCSSFQVAS